MSLYPNWRDILRKAWSVRLIALACLLTGVETVALVIGADWMPFDPVVRAGALFGLSAAALVARIVAQRDV
jgi:hypothetical protein